MKRFACGDVLPGCSAAWVAQSDEELIDLVEWHTAEAHGVTGPPEELIAEVRARITRVA
jgi:predicted small metal-binding protein